MESSDRRAEKTPVSSSKTDIPAKVSKSGSFAAGATAPSYTAAEDGSSVAQAPPPPPPPVMPYYGQYPSLCSIPPGAASMGFSIPPPLGTSSSRGWVPGVMQLPQATNPNTALPHHPYVASYGAVAQPMVYMPVPYHYPSYMTAAVTTPGTAIAPPFNGHQTTKLTAQGATPPYTPSAAAPPLPHSSTIEPAMLPPQFMETPSTNSGASAPAVVSVPPPVQNSVAIEHTVMPLMPNTKLPPGDPFCPAGVTVPLQYTSASAACLYDAPRADASLLLPQHEFNHITGTFPPSSPQSEGQGGTAATVADINAS